MNTIDTNQSTQAHAPLAIARPSAPDQKVNRGCCVAVHVQVTRDHDSDDQVDIVREIRRAKGGPPQQTLQLLLAQTLEGEDLRKTLIRVAELGPLDSQRPLVIERLQVDGRRVLFVEGTIVPATNAAINGLQEVVDGEPDAHLRSQLIELYLADLERPWRTTNGGRLPVRFIDDHPTGPGPSSNAAFNATD